MKMLISGYKILKPAFQGGDMPGNPLPNVGTDLIRIHKVITRALQISLQNSQAGSLADTYQAGYSAYVRALTILLNSHHLGEDELAFPFWKARLPEGPFDRLKQQHRQMMVHLGQIEGWLASKETGWEADARSKLVRGLTYLQRLWVKHIGLEEATVGPENASQYLTPAENGTLARQLAEHGMAHSQPVELVMPFIVYNLASGERVEFVKQMPAVVVEELIPHAWKATWAPMLPFLLPE
jgi:hypothetical protein